MKKHITRSLLTALACTIVAAAQPTTAFARPVRLAHPAGWLARASKPSKPAAQPEKAERAKDADKDRKQDQARTGPVLAFLTLDGPIESRPSPAGLFSTDTALTLLGITDAVDQAGNDPDVKGLLIRIKSADLDGAAVDEIGEALTRFRQSGRKVHVFADSYGGPELALASYADEVIMQSGGEVTYPGVHMEEMFLADTLALAGIKADYVQIGDYKGASEQMARATPSPQWEQNISQLLDASYAHSRARLASGRHLDAPAMDAALSGAMMASGDEAIKLHLIDATIDHEDLDEHFESIYGKDFDYSEDLADATGDEDPAKLSVMDVVGKIMDLLKKDDSAPRTTRDTIAVVHIDAEIIDGDSTGGGLFSEGGVGASTIRDALRDIGDDDNIKGVIVRVDSPGGSAVASEIIWQGIRKLAQSKPVWTSVGSMAASGGYYVSVAGDKIYADPSSIVGSIGVVGGKMALGGLYNLLKVGVVERSRGPLASMDDSATAWTPQQRDLVRARMTQTYEQFVARVKAGRKGIDISKTAEGRLFLGEQAVDLKMVDKLGGLQTAVNDLAQSVSLTKGDYDVVDFPAEEGLKDRLRGMLGGALSSRAPSLGSAHPDVPLASATQALREVLGDRAWRQVRGAASALLQLRKNPVVLAAPRIVIVQ